jgi:hypothetical protein
LVALWTLAAMELGRYLYLPAHQWGVPAGLAGMIVLLMAIFGLQLASMSTALPTSSLDFIRPLIVLAIFGLAGLMTWLVASALSWEFGRLGLVWGAALSLGIYLVAELGGIVNFTPALREIDRFELWQPYPQIAQANLLEATIKDLSAWNTGRRDAIDMRVDVEAPSLRWALRSFEQVSYSPVYETNILPQGSGASLPSIFITRKEAETPSLAAAYRGQDFDWWQSPAWQGAVPPNFLKWLLYRETAWQDEQVVVWARADLFPGGTLNSTDEGANPDQGTDSSSNLPVK